MVVGAVFPMVSSIVLFAGVGLSQQPPSSRQFLAINAASASSSSRLLGMSQVHHRS